MRGFRRSKRAAVLGCGPAGLFAAHGLIENGWDVSIYSNRRKSHMYGAQYLHAPIPGLTPDDEKPTTIQYRLEGDAAGYQQKVYGSIPVKTSPEMLQTEHSAWDIRAAYDVAWERYGDQVIGASVDNDWLGVSRLDGPEPQPMMLQLNKFDAIVSSIPLKRLCYQGHAFNSVRIWAIGDAPERGHYAPFQPPADTVLCDGTRDRGWYRASNVYGHVTVEWPGNRKPPLSGIAEVEKPIYTDCTCYRVQYPIPFIPVGRYGTWQKSVLSHHAYTTGANL